jgi:hypothetical protein
MNPVPAAVDASTSAAVRMPAPENPQCLASFQVSPALRLVLEPEALDICGRSIAAVKHAIARQGDMPTAESEIRSEDLRAAFVALRHHRKT